MLKLQYSNRLEILAETVCEELRGASPFSPPVVLVPGSEVAHFLKRQLAMRHGIAAGTGIQTFHDFLKLTYPDNRFSKQYLIENLLKLFDSTAVKDEALLPVQEYLSPGDPIRAFQLAKELAELFAAYAFSAPDMLQQWESDESLVQTTTERWQKHVWRRLRVNPEIEAYFSRAIKTVPPSLPEQLKLFGFPFFAQAELAVINHFARHSEVTVFSVNPCREFWDDLTHKEEESLPLSLWASPAQFSFRSLNQIANWDVDELSVPNDAENALAATQNSLLERQRKPEVRKTSQEDNSIQIVACDGPQTEARFVADEILRSLDENPELTLDEIVVALPSHDTEVYQANISAAFRSYREIPHYFSKVPLESRSVLAKALELLLDLPLGDFSRPELLRLMTHPALISRFPKASPTDWVSWADRLGIVHGADQTDHRSTYIRKELFHWEQGIERIALGAFMAGERSDTEKLLHFGGRSIAPFEIPEDKIESAAQFSILARSLIEDAKWVRSLEADSARWAEIFIAFVNTYLTATSDWEQNSIERIRQALASIAKDSTGHVIGFRQAREFARLATLPLSTTYGDVTGGGVHVAPLLSVRQIPNKIVFLLGCNEDAFSSRDRVSFLDVRPRETNRVDNSPRLRDRYTFCEALLSCRERFIITYKERDPVSGEPSPLGAPIFELAQFLPGSYTSTHKTPDSPGVGLRNQLTDWSVEHQSPIPSSLELANLIFNNQNQDLTKTLSWPRGLPAEQTPDKTPKNETEAVTLRTLRAFLESPLQAWASYVMGIRETNQEDTATVKDENFSFRPLIETPLLRTLIQNHVRNSETSLSEEYKRKLRYLEMTGRIPTGLFIESAHRRHEDILSYWQEKVTTETEGPYDAVCFGQNSGALEDAKLLPAIRLPSGAEVLGTVDLVTNDALVYFHTNAPKEKHLIRGYVESLAMTAAGFPQRRIIVIGKEKILERTFPSLSVDAAKTRLDRLVCDLLSRDHNYLMPCEAIFEKHKKPDVRFVDLVGKLVSTGRGSCFWGPIRNIASLSPPEEDLSKKFMTERFEDFFEVQAV